MVPGGRPWGGHAVGSLVLARANDLKQEVQNALLPDGLLFDPGI
jgi:hypothetical protein